MDRWYYLIAVLITLVAAIDLRAAIIERDLYEPGDGLLTFDTINRREWLDVTATGELSFAAVEWLLAPGRPLDGFELGSVADVELLVDSSGLNSISMTVEQREAIGDELMTLLGITIEVITEFSEYAGGGPVLDYPGYDGFDYASDNKLIFRLTDGITGDVDMNGEPIRFLIGYIRAGGGGVVRFVNSGGPVLYAGPDPNDPKFPNGMQYRGFWLYREAVPEPATVTLLMTALAVAPLNCRLRRPVHADNIA